MVVGLPKDSATSRAESDYPDWTQETEFLANVIEGVSALTVVFMKAWSEKGARIPDPITVPRPWDRARERRPATSQDLRKLFGSRMRYAPGPSSDSP